MIIFCTISVIIVISIIIFSIQTMIDTKKIIKARKELERFERSLIDSFASPKILKPINKLLEKRTISLNSVSKKKIKKLYNLVNEYKNIPGVSWI